MSSTARALLRDWLRRQLTQEQGAWLDGQDAALQRDPQGAALDIALGMTPRRLGKADRKSTRLNSSHRL